MRLRTLPVSVAGVFAGTACAIAADMFDYVPAVLCLIFAVLAQIASNFGNEYFDYRAGIDRVGRSGPRRGVTEGDITPAAMRNATFGLLAVACCIGLSLIYWGGWWILLPGILIALGAMAYSAGPFPLSRNGLGEVAVIIFFGIAPVNLTFYLQSHCFDVPTLLLSLTVGLMGANVLLVNNYRDYEDDCAVGKRTLTVFVGRRITSALYLLNGLTAALLSIPLWRTTGAMWGIAPAVYAVLHTLLWRTVTRRRGAQLNPLLGITAMLMLLYAVALLATVAITHH